MIEVDRKPLADVLTRMKAVGKDVQYDTVIGEVSKKGLHLWFMSLDITVWETLEGRFDGEDFSFSCDIDKFSPLVSAWKSSTVMLSAGNKNSLIIKAGKDTVHIPLFRGIYDEIQDEPTVTYLGLVDESFVTYIATASAFLRKTRDKPELECVRISCSPKEGVSITGCDSQVFFFAQCVLEEFENNLYGEIPLVEDILLPSRASGMIAKLFPKTKIALYMSDRDFLVMKTGKRTVMFAPYKAEYPAIIETVMKSDGITIINMDKAKCLEALKVSSIVNDSKLIYLSKDDEGIVIKSPKSIMESDIRIDGVEEFGEIDEDIGFNRDFLSNCLRVLDDKRVSIEKIGVGVNGIYRITGCENSNKSTAIFPLRA